MCRYVKAGIVGGLILFIWGAISWMALPYHHQSLNNFTNEKAVADVIQANAPHSGMYFMPTWQQGAQANSPQPSSGPMMLASVHLQGKGSIVLSTLISLLTQIVAAIFVAWLLSKATGSGYFGKLSFVVVFALAAGIVTHIPYWNWFCFDTKFTLLEMSDLVIGWFLAGLVMARMCRN